MGLFGGNDEQINITLKAKDEASKEFDRARLSMGKLAGGVALGTLAADGFKTAMRVAGQVITDSIAEAEQYNQAIGQMNAVLKSTQNAAGLTRRELVDMADALSEVTLYQDDQVLSAQNMLLTFTQITKSVFPDAIQTVLDMSTALGQDLKNSAIQLGKALNDPIQGVTALQRVGVNFTDSQKEQIAVMVKSGHTIEAQNFILQELQREFGGSAKSAYDSASSIVKFEKHLTDLKQGIGSGVIPAVNNLASAFEDVTKRSGKAADIGKITFQVFATMGEFAANTAAGIHFLAGEIVTLTSYTVQYTSVIGLFSKQARQSFSDFRESVKQGVDTTVDFALTLKQKNDAVLKSWGEISDQATVLGDVGPAAYEATAEEAEKAKKKIDDAKRSILDTQDALEGFQKTLRGEASDLGTAFVEEQQKIADLRAELDKEFKKTGSDFDHNRVVELQAELDKERRAFEGKQGLQSQIPGEIAEAQRRAGLTDFERNIEDIQKRIIDTRNEFTQYINFNFNGDVAGDEGIKKTIMETISILNRDAQLAGVAGR